MLRRKKKHPTHANLKNKIPKSRRPINKSNPVRRAREFARAYGSKERVQFVQTIPCILCARTPSVNAHMKSKSGMGRKGDYTTIAALCHECHLQYDSNTLSDWAVEKAEGDAASVEHAWQVQQAMRGTYA